MHNIQVQGRLLGKEYGDEGGARADEVFLTYVRPVVVDYFAEGSGIERLLARETVVGAVVGKPVFGLKLPPLSP